ncbi:MAG: metallophosphoesterase [Lentisphaeria bacterium]|nr:metallophosphoesterase [Lentisphaeria bacterium]
MVEQCRFRLWHGQDPDWRRVDVPTEIRELGNGLFLSRNLLPAPTPELGGRRILYFSDLHWNGDTRLRRAETLIETANKLQADWILFGGDLIRHLADLASALEILARLEARTGKFAVLGNRESAHDWKSTTFWQEAYAGAGFRLLVNEIAPTGTDGHLLLAGLDDVRHGHPDRGLVERHIQASRDNSAATKTPIITLVHSPDGVAGELRPAGDLVFAGHTHGGQFRLPLFGAVYTSSMFGRQFDRGWFERTDGTRMLVSPGVGETGRDRLRFRVNCPAEMHLLDFARMK